ncbi:hypothetical protein L6164_018746 [Bauhinia variegata]|uniref:Uncharacterized protein n=1 Tax=Bauhinia variegata TaxID=167791 RepID=A0ACB9NBZ7_BAUVA|nr:hypothetical protein L6164_018746 [Bauhinia variegata]
MLYRVKLGKREKLCRDRERKRVSEYLRRCTFIHFPLPFSSFQLFPKHSVSSSGLIFQLEDDFMIGLVGEE